MKCDFCILWMVLVGTLLNQGPPWKHCECYLIRRCGPGLSETLQLMLSGGHRTGKAAAPAYYNVTRLEGAGRIKRRNN